MRLNFGFGAGFIVLGTMLAQVSFAADSGLQVCDSHGMVRGAEIAMEKGCFGCHTLSSKRIGPPFREIAAKYQRNPISAQALANKIKNGGTGVWGTMVMPPNPVTEEEALVLAKWIERL